MNQEAVLSTQYSVLNTHWTLPLVSRRSPLYSLAFQR
jgi:hypothetical protein